MTKNLARGPNLILRALDRPCWFVLRPFLELFRGLVVERV